jgi:ABC-type Zn uptake system ZnuABC Zn-binding protein ZnuA
VRGFLYALLLGAIALPGCAVRVASNTGTPSASTSASVNVATTSPVATAIVVGIIAADAVHYYTIGPDGKQPMYGAPDPDPTRKINTQDCTKPVDPGAGNLMCR